MTGSAGAPRRTNPYVGLRPFEAEDERWFFGRDVETRIIGANLRSTRLTLVYGASGVGKSSVLLAAVVPALRAVVASDRRRRERDTRAAPAPVRFAVAVFSTWRDAPLDGLAQAVAAAVGEATGEAVSPWDGKSSLADTFRGWLDRHPVATLLIVLDQFEEYFLYHSPGEEDKPFADELIRTVNDASLNVNFVVSLREDGLAKLDRFKGHIPSLFDNYLRVGHLDLDGARSAIEGPVAAYNDDLPADAEPAVVDDDLVEQVLKEVATTELALDGADADAPAGGGTPSTATDRVETPLLQLVMQRLWEAAAVNGGAPHLRLSTLTDDLKGTEEIVARHLEDALGELPDALRDLAVDVLRPLVSPSGTKIAWRAVDLASFAKRTPAPAVKDVEEILGVLASGEHRILREVEPPQPDQPARYEIFHDILAEPILDWCAAREAERTRDRLAAELAERERKRREARRKRVIRLGGLGLVVVALVLAFVAYQRGQLSDSRAVAASAIEQLPFDPERSVLLALDARERRDTAQADAALRRSLAASHVRAAVGPRGTRRCRACAGLLTPARGGGAVDRRLAVAPDGRAVAAVVGDDLVLWRPQTATTFPAHNVAGAPYGVAFTPDAKHLVVVGTKGAAVMAADGTGAVVQRDPVAHGATSPDGRHVLTVGARAVIRDTDTGKAPGEFDFEDYSFLNGAFDGPRRVVLQGDDGDLVVWTWQAGELRTITLRAPDPGREPIFAAAAGFAVVDDANGKVSVVDTRHATASKPLLLPPGTRADPVRRAYISPDAKQIATVRGVRVDLWSSGPPRPWRRPVTRVAELVHADAVTSVVYSDDGALIGTSSADGAARIWESSTGELVTELRGHTAGVEALAFSSNGRFVATVAEDLTIRVWDLGAERTLRGRKGVDAVGVAGSGVAVVEHGGNLKIWDTRASKPHVLDADPATVDLQPTSVALTADGRSVLAGYETVDEETGRVALRDVASGRVQATIEHSGAVAQVAVDRAGRLAAIVKVTDAGRRVELWQLRRGADARLSWRLGLADRERPTDVALSPDGRRLLVTTVYGAARIYDIGSRKLVRSLTSNDYARAGPEAFIRGVFSPDGATVAVAGSRDVRLWDAASGDERGVRLSGHTSVVHSVAYSADGRRIVTAGADGTTRVWDASDGTELATLRRHAGSVNGAAFLPNGSIVSGGEDRTVRVYPCEICVPTGTLLDLARRWVSRDLTAAEREKYLP